MHLFEATEHSTKTISMNAAEATEVQSVCDVQERKEYVRVSSHEGMSNFMSN